MSASVGENEKVTDSGPCVGSLGRVLVALSRVPETVLYRSSVSVNAIGGVQVNLHGHVWEQVAQVTELLGVGWVPDRCGPLENFTPPRMVARFNDGAVIDGGITVVWFTDQQTVDRLEPIWSDAITEDTCWLPPALIGDSTSKTN